MSLFNCLRKKKAPAPKRVYDFEYRITERKTAGGSTYFTGEGVIDGVLHTLTECRMLKRAHDTSRSLSYGYGGQYGYGGPVPYSPLYRLEKLHIYPGCENNPPAQLSDPVELKEIICKRINEHKNKAKNLAHKKVVSQGRCKCRS